jgi:hypothetical protein
MGFRFRKSIRLLPGVRLNIGTRGASISVGGRGFTTNVSAHGTRTTVGIPGTGLSYSTYTRRNRQSSAIPTIAATSGSVSTSTAPSPAGRWIVGIALGMLALAVFPWSVVLTCVGGGVAVWAWARYRRQNPTARAALARQWEVVKSRPHDPLYATLLSQWYSSDVSDAERRANDVP